MANTDEKKLHEEINEQEIFHPENMLVDLNYNIPIKDQKMLLGKYNGFQRYDNYKYPFAKQFHTRHVTKVIVPRSKFCAEPKSSAYPPPKDLAPTVKSENPIAVTTDAATIGEIIFLQYFANNPKIPSNTPPISTAPITVGYP